MHFGRLGANFKTFESNVNDVKAVNNVNLKLNSFENKISNKLHDILDVDDGPELGTELEMFAEARLLVKPIRDVFGIPTKVHNFF